MKNNLDVRQRSEFAIQKHSRYCLYTSDEFLTLFDNFELYTSRTLHVMCTMSLDSFLQLKAVSETNLKSLPKYQTK